MKKTGNLTVAMDELFTFEPFLDSYRLGGWSGKDKVINKIMEIKGPEYDPDEGSLWTLDLNKFSLDVLSGYIKPSSAGVLLYGDCLSSSLADIIEKAEENKVPIIHSPQDDACKEARSLLALIPDLKRIEKFSLFVRNTIYYHIREKNQSELLAFLESTTNNPIVLVNNIFQVINSGVDIRLDKGNHHTSMLLKAVYENEKLSFKKRELITTGRYKSLILDNGNSIGYVNSPLYSGGYHYGFLIILELNNPISSIDMILFEEARKIILEQLVSRRDLESIEKKHKTDFIHDLLFNNFESKEEVVNRGKHWNYDLSLPHYLFVFEPENQTKKPEETIAKIQSMMFELLGCSKHQPIIGQNQNFIVVLLPESCLKDTLTDKEGVIRLAEKFQQRLESCVPHISYNIGIGRFYPSITDLCRSFQEAKLALQLGKLINDRNGITHFEDLGVMRLLANIDFFQLDDFYIEYLREILTYDEQNESNLLETLIMYFKYNGDINTVAQRMYIHANSLRYRLKKIEELTKTDLKNYEDILNLAVACKIANMYRQQESD